MNIKIIVLATVLAGAAPCIIHTAQQERKLAPAPDRIYDALSIMAKKDREETILKLLETEPVSDKAIQEAIALGYGALSGKLRDAQSKQKETLNK